MLVETVAKGAGQGDNHQRDDCDRQQYVGDQDAEVDRACPACALERDRANVKVIIEIRNQKKR